MPKKRKSLGRDPFADPNEQPASKSLEKLIKGKGPRSEPEAREVSVTVKLTPANIKHLDSLRSQLSARGKDAMSHNDLIRIAIALLSIDDL